MAKRVANIRHLLCALIALLGISTLPSLAHASPSVFQKLQAEYDRFEKDSEARKYRHHYVELARRFEEYAKKWQKSEFVDDALLKAAELSEDIAQITRSESDWKFAEKSYILLAEKFPQSSSADNALYRAARIRFGELKDKNGAKKLLKRLLPKDATQMQGYGKSQNLLAQLDEEPKPVKVESAKPLPMKDGVFPIQSIKVEHLDGKARLMVQTTGTLEVKQGELPKSAQNPRRVYFDLSPAVLAAGVPLEFSANHDGILKVRSGQYKTDVVRVVAELQDGARVAFSSYAGVFSADVTMGSAALAERVSPTTYAPELIKKDPGLRLKKIVIDAGHGGDDPGAIGRGGLREKNVTLAIAKRIKRMIEEQLPDVKVYMTRDEDKTVPLPKRTEIANSLEADLFISIHANAAQNPLAMGIETYYLNIAHDRYAIRLAARENAMSETEISNLEFILADLAMKSNVSDSIRLGQVVQASTLARVKENWQDAKDLGLKHALFYVLLGARMPAILVETSFISNHEEEKRLKSDEYQHALAEGVVKGIRRYVEEKQAMYAP